MKILTVQEPWASLIGEKIKIIETRSWRTNYRGELYIHAGKSKIRRDDERKIKCSKWLKNGFHYGEIFVKCRLTDCILITEEYSSKIKLSNQRCYESGDFTPGRYAWILEDIEYLDTPIFEKGKLGLWNYCSSQEGEE